MRTICGIDPGLDGGVGLLDISTGTVIELVIMPVCGKELDLPDLVRLLQEATVLEEIWLEKVGATPARRVKGPGGKIKTVAGQGVSSAFKFGDGYGSIKGIAAALGIPLELVAPGRWQKTMHTGASGKTAKQRSVSVALRRYPKIDFRRSTRGKVPHSGKVDALLIAEYGRREWLKRAS
jgi:crossover junction endodeoxyribonuclease RuvC